MKKIIVLILCTLTFSAFAQSPKSATIGSKLWTVYTFPTSSDNIAKSSTYLVTLRADIGQTWGYDIYCHLDSISGTAAGVTCLQGKIFSADSWTDIDSVSFGPLKHDDTTWYFQNHNAQYYNYLQLRTKTTSTTGVSRWGSVRFQLWPK
jgi:hypothetical protein